MVFRTAAGAGSRAWVSAGGGSRAGMRMKETLDSCFGSIVRRFGCDALLFRQCGNGQGGSFPGMYIGLGRRCTFKNAKTPPAAAAIPLERLLLETDAPYMTPVPRRGKRCDSTDIQYTAEKIAMLRGCPLDTVLRAGESNAKALFSIG